MNDVLVLVPEGPIYTNFRQGDANMPPWQHHLSGAISGRDSGPESYPYATVEDSKSQG